MRSARSRETRIVEIGPGLAALTGELVARAGHVTAIEIDRDLAARLREEFAPASLTLHEADALVFDYAALGGDLRVVGNLPYNISSPLLFRLAAHAAQLRDVHVMLQREVVARMAAAPATPDYGRLSVMLQVRFRVARLFVVPPGAFRPAPKVESAVARLVPLRDEAPAIADEDCSRAWWRLRSRNGARRCATRSRRCADRRRSSPRASIPAHAARRLRSPISCASPIRSALEKQSGERALEIRQRHQEQLRNHDHDQRRQVERAADRRQHPADRTQERETSAH